MLNEHLIRPFSNIVEFLLGLSLVNQIKSLWKQKIEK